MFTCVCCKQERRGWGRRATEEILQEFGIRSLRRGIEGGLGEVCSTCFGRRSRAFECDVCQACLGPLDPTHRYACTADLRPFVGMPGATPPLGVLITKICSRCFKAATERAVDFASRSKSTATEDDGDVTIHLEADAISSALRTKLHALSSLKGEAVAAFLDLNAFRTHADEIARGLVTLMLKAVGPVGREEQCLPAVALAVEILAHAHEPAYRASVDMIGSWLAQGHCSEDVWGVLCRLGLCPHPTTIRRRLRLLPSRAIILNSIQRLASSPGTEAVAVMDDFMYRSTLSGGVPHDDSGKCYDRMVCGNVVIKSVPAVDPCILADVNGVGHQCPNIVDCTPLLDAMRADWIRSGEDTFASRRPPSASPPGSPYRRADLPMGHGPVTLSGIIPLGLEEASMRSSVGVQDQMKRLVRQAAPLLQGGRALFVVGDWTTYRAMKMAVFRNPQEFGQLIPWPGAFHIGLNLQLGTIEKFHPIFSRMWSSAYPDGPAFPPTAGLLTPTQRRTILEAVDCAWRQTRQDVFQSLDGCVLPPEGWLMLTLLEWFVPLSLDFYSVYLLGDMDRFRPMLVSAWKAFVHLNKCNYQKLCTIMLSDLNYWEKSRPDIHTFVATSLHHMSEEEIELFHSLIRRWSRPGDRGPVFLQTALRKSAAICASNWHSAASEIMGHRNGARTRPQRRRRVRERACEGAKEIIQSVFRGLTDQEIGPGRPVGEAVFTRTQMKSAVLQADFPKGLLPWCVMERGKPWRKRECGPFDPFASGPTLCPGSLNGQGTPCETCKTRYENTARCLQLRISKEIRGDLPEEPECTDDNPHPHASTELLPPPAVGDE